MKNNKQGFIGIILLITVIIALGIAAIIFKPPFLKPQNKTNGEGVDKGITYKKGDITQDGKVDILDERLVQTNINCHSSDACWTKVIDHTQSGYNPIYVKDLDINKDNVIDEKDLNELTK